MNGILNKLKSLIRFGMVTNIDNDSKPLPQAQYKYFNKVKDVICVYPYGFSANAPLNNLAVLWNVGHEENSVALPFSGQNRYKGLKQGEVIVSNYLTKSIIKFLANGDIEINGTNDLNVIVSKDHNHNIGGDMNMTVSGDHNHNIGGNILVTSGGTTTINSTGDITITAPNTNITTELTNTGNVTFNGNLQVNGTITSTGVISGPSVSASGAISAATMSAGGIDLGTHAHSGVTTGPSNTGPPV